MNWDDFRIFLALARNPHLRLAAEVVRLDPTTIGRRISRLEEALDATLFEQYTGSYLLTKRGQKLFELAERIETAAFEAQEDQTSKEISGRIRVSSSEAFGLFIAQHLHRFSSQYPEVLVDLIATPADRRMSPSKRESDIAISSTRPERGQVSIRKLCRITNQLYASQDYLKKHPEPQQPEDLVDHSIVGFIPDLLYTADLDVIHDINPDVGATVRCSSMAAQRCLISSGIGVGMLPVFVAAADPALVPLLGARGVAFRDLWIIIHQESRGFRRIQVFNEWLAELVALERPSLAG